MTHHPPDPADNLNAIRGHIISLKPCVIYSSVSEGRVVWDNDAYNFLKDECPNTANGSLWRQSKLCAEQGLFKVTDGVYQVRGFDISNVTFVETTTIESLGVVVIDPLISYECAKKALELYLSHRPGRLIRALIYTHSHIDHFGGAGAIIEAAGADLPIYAPDGFFEHAVSENVYAGSAMLRRSVYMYGTTLERGPKGQIGVGLGLATSSGKASFVPPTVNITTTGQSAVIDGLEIVFQVTPGTEAPSEMNFFFPQYKALCMAENASHTMHNIQILRGALVQMRDSGHGTWTSPLSFSAPTAKSCSQATTGRPEAKIISSRSCHSSEICTLTCTMRLFDSSTMDTQAWRLRRISSCLLLWTISGVLKVTMEVLVIMLKQYTIGTWAGLMATLLIFWNIPLLQQQSDILIAWVA
jgi:alkyl sulfatase BDS1-like metallo-beta-lactamase superfamily hydrolase